VLDTVSDDFNDADNFVAGNDRQGAGRQFAVDQVEVRTAHAAGMYADQHLTGQRDRDFTFDSLHGSRSRFRQRHRSHRGKL
jgi:hypothetical protein